jgi:two-component system response regulator YesN
VNLNILAIDDEEVVTELINALFQRMGHSVDQLHNAQDALSRIKNSPDHYDILITDHLMHKVTGLELLSQLPKNSFKGKIIVISGYMTNELENEYRALGASKIIRKPFNIDELRKAVEELKPGTAT